MNNRRIQESDSDDNSAVSVTKPYLAYVLQKSNIFSYYFEIIVCSYYCEINNYFSRALYPLYLNYSNCKKPELLVDDALIGSQ